MSKRGLTQTDDESLSRHEQIGLVVNAQITSSTDITQALNYYTSNGSKVSVINPFLKADGTTGKKYGEDITITYNGTDFSVSGSEYTPSN